MNRGRSVRGWLISGLILAAFACPSHAFNQPPVNLSATTFLDGGAPPGIYYLNYVLFVEGRKAKDSEGNVIPGGAEANVLVQLNQLYLLSPYKLLGGNVGLDIVVPVVAPTVKGGIGPVPLTANTAGMGDWVIAPALQWDGKSLFGGPLFQRVEFLVTLPTGKYDKNKLVNPGSNLLTLEPYYSFVWLFHPKWETSWRLFYAFHGENDDTKTRPGRLFHANWAVSRQVSPRLRLGAAGYGLQQTTEDEVNGVDAMNSKERAFAAGPGLFYTSQGLMLALSHPVEFGVRNRFQGRRTTLQFIHRF
ncbi:MAG: SphA family protein [Elusimicrobiota bacterium]